MVTAGEERPAPPPQRAHRPSRPGKPVSLLIEDNPDNLRTARALLQDKYQVVEATDGRAGLEQAEEEKVKLEAQLQQAQKMESVGRLAGVVAHDFNNMLSVILGYAEMALEKTDPASALYGDLQEIHNAGVRSAKIIRQLLAFARKQTIAPQLLDLNETVESMLKMLRRLIGEDINTDFAKGTHELYRFLRD